ncbi:MAG: hypothetical protein WBV55_01200 [Candidatus Sulfotelmatobacter sp.]
MLLTITNTKSPATDLGYLLHKDPNRLQSSELSFGKFPFIASIPRGSCLLVRGIPRP